MSCGRIYNTMTKRIQGVMNRRKIYNTITKGTQEVMSRRRIYNTMTKLTHNYLQHTTQKAKFRSTPPHR